MYVRIHCKCIHAALMVEQDAKFTVCNDFSSLSLLNNEQYVWMPAPWQTWQRQLLWSKTFNSPFSILALKKKRNKTAYTYTFRNSNTTDLYIFYVYLKDMHDWHQSSYKRFYFHFQDEILLIQTVIFKSYKHERNGSSLQCLERDSILYKGGWFL